jgi:hypothetical protein
MAGTQANTGQWFEPETPYATIKGVKIPPRDNASKSTVYPFNKVTETESGHIVEFDDTPHSERIHIYHRSGSFFEFHPNGDKVDKVVRDYYLSILRDGNIHVDGFANLTVDKGLKIYVNRDNLENSENASVNFDIHVGQNANVNLFVEKGNCNVRLVDGDANLQIDKGDINIRQDSGNYNHFINGDYNLECTGHMHTVVGRHKVEEIGGSRDVRVDGQFDNLEVTFGYKETKVQGDHRLQVGGSVYELFEKTHQTRVLLDRLINITGNRDTVIGLNETTTITGENNTTISGSNKISTIRDLDISTGGFSRISSASGTDIGSGGRTTLSSSSMHLNGGAEVIVTGGVVHWNGPTAEIATPATPALVSVKSPIYVPGPGAPWIPTSPSHPRSPLGQLQIGSAQLTQQLGVVSVLEQSNNALTSKITEFVNNNNQLSGLLEQGDALGSAVKENISGSLALAQDATTGINDISNSALNTIKFSGGVASGAIASATAATSGLSGNIPGLNSGSIGGEIPDLTSVVREGSQDLGALGDVFTGIGSVIGDVIDAIVEVGCAIGDLINGIIDSVVGPILQTINSVFGKISEILGEINKIIGDILSKIGEVINGILGAINDIIGKIIDAAGRFIGGIASAINGLLSNLFEGFSDIGCGDGILSGQEPPLGTQALAPGVIT